MKTMTYSQTMLIAISLLMSTFFHTSLFAQCDPVSDSLALVAIYNATNGENWTDDSNWLAPGQPIGAWKGITTNEEGCIEKIFLQNNNLSGIIPPEIGDFTDLIDLLLYDNQLTGNIPPEIGNLVSLTIRLALYENQLSGSIPAEIGNLTNLSSLWIRKNQLSGSIPPEIGNLINLASFSAEENQLTGNIPPEIGGLTSAISLILTDNQLSGSIPAEIGNLDNLEYLVLDKNQLTGSIPSEIGNSANLEYLILSQNQLSGNIPSEVGNLANLGYLILDKNQLTGSIPPEIGNLSNLIGLVLNDNQLTGNIPYEISNLPSVAGIVLNNNQLTGVLPIELSNLTTLSTLILSDNNFYGCFPPLYTSFCDLNDVNFSGNPGLPSGGNFDAFCANNSGACNPTIIGTVTLDENQNCIADALEIGLQNWMVKASSPDGDLFGITDENGAYSIYTYPAEYTVELIAPGPYWDENCSEEVIITIADTTLLDTINFLPQAVVNCPFMTVDISTPFLRPCMPSVYSVNYCNSGTALAENVYIEVTFDDLIQINTASIPISNQIDNTLTFDLGNIDVNVCGSFLIYTDTSCDVELGQTLCASAHIRPDSICAEISPEWSGATVAVEGFCAEDGVHFIIENIGEGDMINEVTYVVVEDGLILSPIPVPFILNTDGELEVIFPANGNTYTCQAMQVENHPIPSFPTAFVEACGTNAEGNFSTGYATQFAEGDSAPFISIDCQEVIGSFDPNDKQGYPKGYGEEYFIERGQDIEYKIRFQNTGTDTAFIVIIEDVLPPNLEMTSLVQGASSHPYRLEITESNTLRFIFENILLVDSLANEPASHGFVKFKVSQKPDLPLGTKFENTAAIFFDFNDPVITNTTLHTIGEHFVEITATQEPFIDNLKVSLSPNPVSDKAVIQISGVEYRTAQITILNSIGVVLKQDNFSDKQYIINNGDLPKGIYFFEIKLDGKQGFVGKMAIN